MKIMDLRNLLELSELAFDNDSIKSTIKQYKVESYQSAIAAAQAEIDTRVLARKLYKKTRPAQTVRRKDIRQQLKSFYHQVRLTRKGEWHVQVSAGASWMVYAIDDSDAENSLHADQRKSKMQPCGCLQKHSDAAGVIEACILGQQQGADEYWTGF